MFLSHPPCSLIFIHIPRTGGTSTTNALVNRYGDQNLPRTDRKHVSGRTFKKGLPIEQWRLAYKFTIVRNPWSRMVSLWNFHKGSLDNPERGNERGDRSLAAIGFEGRELKSIKTKIIRSSFCWWLLEFNRMHKWIPYRFNTGRLGLVTVPQIMWLTDDMDRIFRFEQLEEVADTLDLAIPWLNANLLTGTDYRQHYDAEARDWVARVYAPDIHRFGYDF